MKIYIEFCERWNYHPEFDRVSKIVKKYSPESETIGNENPPRTGAFEVIINDNLVFSKFKCGSFPSETDIRSWL